MSLSSSKPVSAFPRSIRPSLRLAALFCTCASLFTPRAAHAQRVDPRAAAPTHYTWVGLQPTGSGGRLEIFDPSSQRYQPDADVEDRGWTTLCVEPCGQWVPAGAKLRVNGRFKTGESFVLPHGGPLTIVASPGRRDVRGIGLTLGIGGTVVLGIAGLVAMFADAFSCGDSNDARSTCGQRHAETQRDALIVAGISAIPATAGWLMFAMHNQTSIELRSGSSPTRPVFAPVALGGGLSLSPKGIHF